MKVLVKFPDGHKNTYDTASDLESFKNCFPGAEFEVLESNSAPEPPPAAEVVVKRFTRSKR